MKYIIIRAQCRLSNGSIKVLRYNKNSVTEQNTCDNVDEFRANLKKSIENSMKITVLSISLTYEEYDDKK